MHPLATDLTGLTDDQLYQKQSELSKKVSMAYRSGNMNLVYQIQLLIEDYQNEINVRREKSFAQVQSKAKDAGFKNIIDIQ